MKFEIYEDKKDEWRWRLKASNGKIVAVGESYKRKRDANRAIQSMLKGLKKGSITEMPL
jgi:uncharacterized protein YegP (UPF0339 family)